MASIKDREIFKIGRWRGSSTVNVDAAYLADMILSYVELNSKVSGFAIPLKLGHNKKVGEPAFGYAENIHLSEDGGTVLADFNDVPAEIVDAITKKQYNTVSVEIYPKVEFGGVVHKNVLSGVALLGAEWPAVKGLRPLSMFSEDGEQSISLSQEEDADMNFTQADIDTAVAAARAEVTLTAAAATTAEKERADRAEAALAAFADEAEKAAVVAVIEAAEKAGKIVPANKAAVLAMSEAIRLSVDPAKRKEALTAFSAFVEAMPAKVKFGEKAASEQADPNVEASAGAQVDVEVKKLMAADKNKTYRAALDEVFAALPDLKTAYAEENR